MPRRNEVDILIKARDEASRKLNNVEKEASQLSKTTKALGSIFNKTTLAIGATVAGLGFLTAKTKKLIDLASDTVESMNKVKEVFGDSAESVIAFAETGATALGASTQQTLEMTGTIGNLLVAMKFTEEEAANMSQKIVQLAADLGSFNNVGTEEALVALRAALVGETEPIRRFGSDVRVARLEQMALADGLQKTKAGLDAKTKALYSLQAIFEDTHKAQGDFARTSDDLANATKTLKANLAGLGAALGEKLIPAATNAVSIFNEFIESFTMSDFDKTIQRLIALGAEVSFVDQLKVQKQVNDSLKSRVELTEKIKNFELEFTHISMDENINLAIRLSRERQILRNIIEQAKTTKDTHDLDLRTSVIRDRLLKINGDLSEIANGTLTVEESKKKELEEEERILQKLVGSSLDFQILLKEREQIEQRIKGLKADETQDQENTNKATQVNLEQRKAIADLLYLNRKYNADLITAEEAQAELLKRKMLEWRVETEYLLASGKAIKDNVELNEYWNQESAESLLLSTQQFQVFNQFAPALARAVAEGRDLKNVINDMVTDLAARGLTGLLGAGIGFMIGGPGGAMAGFNIGSGLPVFDAQHGDSGVFPGQGSQERVYWGLASPGEEFNIKPKGSQKTIMLNVAGGGESFNMSKRGFQSFMREVGYDVIVNDTAKGKGL